MNGSKPKAVISQSLEPCQCGGMKTKGARQCNSCRYSVPSAAKEPERVTKESLVAAMDIQMANEWLRKSIRVAA